MDKLLCTWFGIGNIRPASGTWGSLVALFLGILIHRIGSFPLLALATITVTLLGFWAVPRYTTGLGDPDRSEIVIDEVAGQWFTLCFPSLALWWLGHAPSTFPWPAWVSSFVFFRLFDIWKPWLIGRADRNGGVNGVMLDDLWAGFFAGILIWITAIISHGFLM
ncbi:MAG: phosphatidylglycerophosphatase A [Paracoccus sp. (in: a-proteobacteria)]